MPSAVPETLASAKRPRDAHAARTSCGLTPRSRRGPTTIGNGDDSTNVPRLAAIVVAILGGLIAAAGSLVLFVLWRLGRDPHLLITSFVVVPAWALGVCCFGLAGVLVWRRIGLVRRAMAVVAMVAGGGVLLFVAAAFFSRL